MGVLFLVRARTWPHKEGITPRTWCHARPGSYDIVCPVDWCLRVADILEDFEIKYYMVLLEVSRTKRLKQYAIPFLVQSSGVRKIAEFEIVQVMNLMPSVRDDTRYYRESEYVPYMNVNFDDEDKKEMKQKKIKHEKE